MLPHHLALKVTDLSKVLPFYQTLLGLTVMRKAPHSVWLESGPLILMLEEDKTRTLRPAQSRGWHLFALQIAAAERDTWKKRLLAAGVHITRESAHSLYFEDPEGNGLALSHYPTATVINQ